MSMAGGQLQDFTIDQFAGALALSLGAVGTLLLVIWQSRCRCRCRLGCSDKCYVFDCERAPPVEVAPTDDEVEEPEQPGDPPEEEEPEVPAEPVNP